MFKQKPSLRLKWPDACVYMCVLRFQYVIQRPLSTCNREKEAWVGDWGEAEVGGVLSEVAGSLEGDRVEAWGEETALGVLRKKLSLLSQLTSAAWSLEKVCHWNIAFISQLVIFLGHLGNSGDPLLLVGVLRRPSCVKNYIVLSKSKTHLVCNICWVRRQEILNFMTPTPSGGNFGVNSVNLCISY